MRFEKNQAFLYNLVYQLEYSLLFIKFLLKLFLDELLSISYQQTNLYKSLLNNQAKEH
jgi:hypothetical protein